MQDYETPLLKGTVLASIGTLLAACQQPTPVPPTAAPEPTKAAEQPAAPPEPTAAPRQEPVTITYAFWDQSLQPYINDSLAAFNKMEPNIQVELQVIPWNEYWPKLQSAAAGGQVADVLWMDVPYYNIYAKNGVLMKLDPLIERDGLDMSMYPVNSYDGLADGMYVLPSWFDVMGLWYNKKIFDQAGVAYPSPDWTWDDLKAAAKQIKQNTGVYGFASVIDGYQGWWNFVAQNGGKLHTPDGATFTFDDAAGCEAIDFYTSFIREGLSPDGPTLASATDTGSLFTGGQVAMMIFGGWMFKTVHEACPDCAVTALPKGKVATSYTHTMSNAMWSGTKHPEEAWKFLKFLGSKEGLSIIASTGSSVPDYKGLENDWINSIPGIGLEEVYSQVGHQTSWPPGTMEYFDGMNSAFQDAYNGNIPWDQLCKEATRLANEARAKAAEQ